MEPAKECVTTHLPKRAAPKTDGAQVSEAEFVPQSTATVAGWAEHWQCKGDTEACSSRWGCPPPEWPPAQILVAVASTHLGEELEQPMLRAIEDWSGAGFRTKQPLNAGQPTVSQVVKAPNNQSCNGGSILPTEGTGTTQKAGRGCPAPSPAPGCRKARPSPPRFATRPNGIPL